MRLPLIPILNIAVALAYATPALAQCEGYASTEKPQNTGRNVVGLDLDGIAARGWIEFALYEDFPPYSWQDDSGAATGVDIGIGRLIAKALGVSARFRFVTAAESVDDDLLYYVWKGDRLVRPVSNVMLHIPYDKLLACRIGQVVLTGQTYTERLAIAYRKTAFPNGPARLGRFTKARLAVESHSLGDIYASSLLRGEDARQIVRFTSAAEAMAALRAAEVDMAILPRMQAEFGGDSAIAVHTPEMPGLPISEWTVGVAVHHAYRPLAYAIDDAISSAIADGRIEAIFASYGLGFARAQR